MLRWKSLCKYKEAKTPKPGHQHAIHARDSVTGLQNVEDKCCTKIHIQAAKLETLISYSMHKRMPEPIKCNLKRSSF